MMPTVGYQRNKYDRIERLRNMPSKKTFLSSLIFWYTSRAPKCSLLSSGREDHKQGLHREHPKENDCNATLAIHKMIDTSFSYPGGSGDGGPQSPEKSEKSFISKVWSGNCKKIICFPSMNFPNSTWAFKAFLQFIWLSGSWPLGRFLFHCF